MKLRAQLSLIKVIEVKAVHDEPPFFLQAKWVS
jgi:hypothetical protein